MYIAYSKNNERPARKKKPQQSSFIEKMEHKLWLKAIKEVMEEKAEDIKEIQKHFPGWQPIFTKPDK